MRRASLALLTVAAACASEVTPIETCPGASVRVDGICRVPCESSATCLSGEICDTALGVCRRRGADEALLRFDPLELDLGAVGLGSHTLRDLTLFNDGASTDDITVRYEGSPAFVLSNPSSAPFALDTGFPHPFQIDFAPETEGDHAGRLIATGCAGACTAELPLKGSARKVADVTCTPSRVEFGDLDPLNVPVATVRCANLGTEARQIIAIHGTPDVLASGASVSELAPDESFDFDLTPTLTRTGAFSDQIEIELDSGLVTVVPVSGRVLSGGLRCEPAELELGAVAPGATARAQVECTNRSGVAITPRSVFVTPAVPSISVIVGAPLDQPLAPGGVLQIDLTWAPTDTTPLNGILHVTTDADPVDVPLRGNAPSCTLESPYGATFDFGTTDVARPHAASVPVRNVGAAACSLTVQVTTEVAVMNAPRALGPGALAWIELRYSPNAATLNGRLTVSAPEARGPLTVALTGRRGTPPLYASDTRVTWGSIPAGCDEGSHRDIDLVNLGGNPLGIGGLELVTAVPSFALATPAVASLAAGERLRLRVEARPRDVGPVRGRLHVTQGNQEQYIELYGDATNGLPHATGNFDVPAVDAIDVLFVLDGDNRTGAITDGVRTAAQAFFDAMGTANYHVGVINAQTLAGIARGNLQGQPTVITPANAAPGAALASRLATPGISLTEAPLLGAATEAVGPRRATNANAGFLRPDGQLDVVIITARDDDSQGTVTSLVDLLRDRTIGRPRAVRVSAISGGANGCRISDGGSLAPAPRVLSAVRMTGGLDLSGCAPSPESTVLQLGTFLTTPPRATFFLDSEAIPGTLVVSTASGNEPAGWSYERSRGWVVFDDVAQPRATVRIEWTPWCLSPTCGNGRPEPLELCDDGNLSEADPCTNLCHDAACGDGRLYGATEECDDGNLDDEDGCTRACTFGD